MRWRSKLSYLGRRHIHVWRERMRSEIILTVNMTGIIKWWSTSSSLLWSTKHVDYYIQNVNFLLNFTWDCIKFFFENCWGFDTLTCVMWHEEKVWKIVEVSTFWDVTWRVQFDFIFVESNFDNRFEESDDYFCWRQLWQ